MVTIRKAAVSTGEMRWMAATIDRVARNRDGGDPTVNDVDGSYLFASYSRVYYHAGLSPCGVIAKMICILIDLNIALSSRAFVIYWSIWYVVSIEQYLAMSC